MVPMTVVHTSVSLPGMATDPWTDEENDLIVADYFAMLAADLTGRPYTSRRTGVAAGGKLRWNP